MDQSKRDHDVCIENHGSLFTFALRSERAREWWQDNVSGDLPTIGLDVYPVEHRTARDIAQGMLDDGLEVV
jgi:hypothetical protein